VVEDVSACAPAIEGTALRIRSDTAKGGVVPIYWLVIWSVTEVVIFVAAVWSWWSRRAMYVGRAAVATLFLVGGALFNTMNFATGGDYGEFADGSYLPFVTDTWRSLVAPNQDLFIPLLIAFEVVVGVLVLMGGRKTQLALVLAIAFHIGLMFFGWEYYPYSVAMIVAFGLLLYAEGRRAVGGLPPRLETRTT
jgi:hypothetical protein